MQKLMTAIAAALFLTISLKGLHVFHLIKWNPIKFLQQFEKVEWSVLACWMMLFFMLMVVAYLLLVLLQLSTIQAPFTMALILGVFIAFFVEWQVRNLSIEWASLKKVSIPFTVFVLIVLRFLTETAHSMRK